jgi:F-type H+-transporting ATPase subunit gamma
LPNLLNIKNKIQSTKNTGQITKALELVSASKQKKSNDFLNNSRYLRVGIRDLINKLRHEIDALVKSDSPEIIPEYFKHHNSDKVLILNTMSQRGLCGSINTNLFFKLAKFTQNLGKKAEFISINKTSQRYLKNFKEDILMYFNSIKDNPSVDDILPIIDFVKENYHKYDSVYLSFVDFIKPGVFEPKISKLLPIEPEEQSEKTVDLIYKIEPNPLEVLSSISNLYIDLEIYEAVLSTQVSEHSARVAAMKKASDNAKEMTDDLTLTLNKARQAKITAQMSEISVNL